MSQRTIVEIAEGFGLSVEDAPDQEDAFIVYKGANQVFTGTEDAIRDFLSTYERPAMYAGSMYGYKE